MRGTTKARPGFELAALLVVAGRLAVVRVFLVSSEDGGGRRLPGGCGQARRGIVEKLTQSAASGRR